MKPMIYKGFTEEPEILHEGIYREHDFCIVNNGSYPCAYVEDKENIKYSILDERLNVHGGITYTGHPYWKINIEDLIKLPHEEFKKHKNYIGWDYAHCGDFFGKLVDGKPDPCSMRGKIWKTEEIYSEAKDVIDQLIRLGD